MNKKIIITGASGLIGRNLFTELIKRNYSVSVITTNKNKSKLLFSKAENIFEWNELEQNDFLDYLQNVNCIIHLSGANIANKRWNTKYKEEIFNSRIQTTKKLVDTISHSERKLKSFICASATGYYGNRKDELLTEESTCGDDYLSFVCKNWEEEASKVEQFGIRRVSIRTGIVLSNENGALKRMLTPYKIFIGGPLGNGKQWFPYIHIDDIVNVYLFALENEMINGAVNAVSKNLLTMKEFATELGKVLNRPSIFSVPKFALKIILGESSESILASQKVYPQKLIVNGFNFKFDNLEKALRNLIK
ncbi:MAG: TIGR01777 family oxidoreductase [Ignavibacterium sp.]